MASEKFLWKPTNTKTVKLLKSKALLTEERLNSLTRHTFKNSNFGCYLLLILFFIRESSDTVDGIQAQRHVVIINNRGRIPIHSTDEQRATLTSTKNNLYSKTSIHLQK